LIETVGGPIPDPSIAFGEEFKLSAETGKLINMIYN
jgi:hypothetical protein